jgi:ATP-dependent 26S proteasome regulatory subunit
MRQKGKGLVVLLYGTPGSGKTLTAETAAEGSGKALIMTSLGELNKEDRYV